MGYSQTHTEPINVLIVVRDGHRYVFLFDDASKKQAWEKAGDWAKDDRLGFTWADAAVIANRICRV